MPEADILSELVQSTLATQANHVHFLMTFQALFNITYCTCPSTLLLFLIESQLDIIYWSACFVQLAVITGPCHYI